MDEDNKKMNWNQEGEKNLTSNSLEQASPRRGTFNNCNSMMEKESIQGSWSINRYLFPTFELGI